MTDDRNCPVYKSDPQPQATFPDRDPDPGPGLTLQHKLMGGRSPRWGHTERLMLKRCEGAKDKAQGGEGGIKFWDKENYISNCGAWCMGT